jgi:GTP diphosphokinase / guanosine-3',5'-bis(diphosphate) 3'-diphosphatase
VDDMYRQIANGGAIVSKTGLLLIGYYHEEKKEDIKKQDKAAVEALSIKNKQPKRTNSSENVGIIVEGIDNLMIRMSKCCNPVPGDEIIGFITKGRGISVHRADCVNILSLPDEERARCIQVQWDESKMDKASYDADVCIVAEDRRGLISDLSKVCEDNDVNITGVMAKSGKDQIVNITMTLTITNIAQVEKLLRSFKSVPGVADVYRAVI